MNVTPRQRMLNAYRGAFSDRCPVAPEFWYYYPAKVLGVDMIQLLREIPLWQALQTTFRKYGTEGWGITGPDCNNPLVSGASSFDKISATQYRLTHTTRIAGREFTGAQVYDAEEPCWTVEYPVKDEKDLAIWIDASLSSAITWDFAAARKAVASVGEDYLLEVCAASPFFDWMAGFMGFERTLMYFMSEESAVLEGYRKRYTDFQVAAAGKACEQPGLESFFIGCCYACPSLTGPHLWRRWDKPVIKAVVGEFHRHGKLVHMHFHGRCMETLADLAEIGVDCVCPFERPPGGDIDGLEDLKKVRNCLGDRVTMNGNVHTVETLIRGTPQAVRAEVRQIKEAYAGCPRLIIGTGDQVGRETPEENILAMIEEAKKPL
jgi:hypothetical protein